jgi:N-ethylmaleimide reductase
VGRISHVSLLPGGAAPVSSTARPALTKTYIAGGFAECSAPRALRTDEMAGVVADYVHAARCAMDAGFDGVEVHGANGYLIDQFLRDSINDRSDAYGGTIENRVRLLVEVMQAVTKAIGGGRTGLRLSPVTPSNDAGPDSDPQALMAYAVAQLAPLKLAYLHLIEGQTGGPRDVAPFDYAALRRAVPAAPGWSTTATHARWRWTPWLAARPTWWPSARPSSPTPTWGCGCAKTRRSTHWTRHACTAAVRRVTPTTPR